MSSRYEKGLEIFKELVGEEEFQRLSNSLDVLPDFEHFAMEFAFGDIYSRPGLNRKMRQIGIISSLVTQKTIPLLKVHLRVALNIGMTKSEILELILQMVPYTGFPSAAMALMAAKEVFETKPSQ